MPCNGLGHEFLERRLQLSAAGRPGQFLVVPRGRNAGGLVDDHDIVVEVHDPHLTGVGRCRRGHFQHLHHLSLLEPPGGVGADVAVDEHAARPHQLLGVRPAGTLQPAAQERGQRPTAVGGGDVVRGSGERFHDEGCRGVASIVAHAGRPTRVLDPIFRGFTLCGEVTRPQPPHLSAS
jgi:hypothetical protein